MYDIVPRVLSPKLHNKVKQWQSESTSLLCILALANFLEQTFFVKVHWACCAIASRAYRKSWVKLGFILLLNLQDRRSLRQVTYQQIRMLEVNDRGYWETSDRYR
ncbi:hypothetical protein [Tumidithrix helvetica]|uniref:hypothetical protein n=1 Tax=Tumidithrix helvetica TaxID=3457545 RepID=UPI003CC5E3FF